MLHLIFGKLHLLFGCSFTSSPHKKRISLPLSSLLQLQFHFLFRYRFFMGFCSLTHTRLLYVQSYIVLVRFWAVRSSMQHFSPSRLLIKLLCCTCTLPCIVTSHVTCTAFFRPCTAQTRKSTIADSLFTRARCDCRDSLTEKHCGEWGRGAFSARLLRF